MALLIQFLLRLTFGLALGMFITSSKLVTSGYYRNHLYVTLGLASLAAMLSFSVAPETFWYAVAAAVFSYLGAVYWLFEKSATGKLMLLLVVLAAWFGASSQTLKLIESKSKDRDDVFYTKLSGNESASLGEIVDSFKQKMNLTITQSILLEASVLSSGLLLGLTMAAMLLGHWYLNSPTMELVPLQRLILAMAFAVGLQAVLSALGLWGEIANTEPTLQWILFLLLRWTFGLVGVAAMTWMAWQTLKIPNTQSATGILYVAVIGTFVGETMALLLSTESLFPL